MPAADSGIVLRLARDRDAADLVRLSGLLGFPITEDRAAARLRDVSGVADQAVIVAESGGRVAGLIELRRVRLVTAWRQVEVIALVVDEEFRGRGIGSRLLAESERWAHDLRCGKVRVRSNTERERAQLLYQRSGFQAARNETLFEKQLDVRPKSRGFVPTSVVSTRASASGRGAAVISIVRVAVAVLLVFDGILRAGSGAVSGFGVFVSPELGWAPGAIEIAGGLALASRARARRSRTRAR
jgi:ribosomal protein S18 acetylase RimI-like enzyme